MTARSLAARPCVTEQPLYAVGQPLEVRIGEPLGAQAFDGAQQVVEAGAEAAAGARKHLDRLALPRDLALERVGEAALDWSGGTRLGDGLRAFNDEWGQRGMARGATVVILSDGWDRGDPRPRTTPIVCRVRRH